MMLAASMVESVMPAKGQKKSLEARFWAKVDSNHGLDECWPWLGSTHRQGYGLILSGDYEGSDYKKIGAHVAAMILAGRFEEGLDVLHNCNNPSCVNERHLRMGTHRENMADAIKLGTFNYNPCGKGEKSMRPKLCNWDVKVIRQLWRDGMTHVAIARMFPVAREAVGLIVRRQRWGHI